MKVVAIFMGYLNEYYNSFQKVFDCKSGMCKNRPGNTLTGIGILVFYGIRIREKSQKREWNRELKIPVLGIRDSDNILLGFGIRDSGFGCQI